MTSDQLKAIFDPAKFEGNLLFDEPLFKHTYYRIGGPAALVANPKTETDLRNLSKEIIKAKIPYFFLGNGSNVLAADEGFAGIVIKTSRLNLLVDRDGKILRTGASVGISTLLRKCAQEGWGGLEFLTGVPGTVGGAIFMNAGTHLGETASKLKSVKAFLMDSGQSRDFTGADLKFEYRKNLFLPPDAVVLSAVWNFTFSEPAKVKALIDETLARRKATQPLDAPSCGSVFKNPPDRHAWQVIDELGLRGHRIGDAQISEKHCNFIVNLGAAKASDVRALIALVKSRARESLALEMHEEVVYLGDSNV